MKPHQLRSSSTYLMTSPQGNIAIQGIRKINGDYIFLLYDEYPPHLLELCFDHRPTREQLLNSIVRLQDNIEEYSCEQTKKTVQYFMKYIKKHKGNVLQKLHKVILDIKFKYEKSDCFTINKSTVSFNINLGEQAKLSFIFRPNLTRPQIDVQLTIGGLHTGFKEDIGLYTTETLLNTFNRNVDPRLANKYSDIVQKAIEQNKNELELLLYRFNNKLRLV
ncbi:hypothetical protein CF8_0031 [Aeromonas phage CF8]|nr:hypothetical protein CF8_0031 [Aeromonas phage CF8]